MAEEDRPENRMLLHLETENKKLTWALAVSEVTANAEEAERAKCESALINMETELDRVTARLKEVEIDVGKYHCLYDSQVIRADEAEAKLDTAKKLLDRLMRGEHGLGPEIETLLKSLQKDDEDG